MIQKSSFLSMVRGFQMQGQTTSGPGPCPLKLSGCITDRETKTQALARLQVTCLSSESERPRAAARVRTLNHRDLRVRLVTGKITD